MGQLDDRGIGPLFEASGGLAANAEPAGRLRDGHRLEPGHLDQDIGRAFADLRRGASHDPADTVGLVVGIADEEIVVGERALDVVERDEVLAIPRAAHPQPAAFDTREVVGV